jgi:hypothetical protein
MHAEILMHAGSGLAADATCATAAASCVGV